MSDGYSVFAKNFWKGLKKDLDTAVDRARPFKALVHNPLTPYVRIAKPGDIQTVDQATNFCFHPGQPLPGEQVVAVTLDSGEIIILGAIRDSSSDEVSLVTSPLIWRRTLGDATPIRLEWMNPGIVKVTDGAFIGNDAVSSIFYSATAFSNSTVSYLSGPGVNFTIPPGTWTCVGTIYTLLNSPTLSATSFIKARLDGLDGSEVTTVLNSASDVGVTTLVRKLGVISDGVTPINLAPYIRANVAGQSINIRNSSYQLLAQRTD
jgi:hypothetical protein